MNYKYFFVPLPAALFLHAAAPCAHAGDPLADNAFDRMGDWFAVLGKSGIEKEQILAERKVRRKARKAEKLGRESIENTGETARGFSEETRRTGEKLREDLGL